MQRFRIGFSLGFLLQIISKDKCFKLKDGPGTYCCATGLCEESQSAKQKTKNIII